MWIFLAGLVYRRARWGAVGVRHNDDACPLQYDYDMIKMGDIMADQKKSILVDRLTNENYYRAANDRLYQTIRENMRTEREHCNFTIWDLAAKLKLPWVYVGLVEMGMHRPSLQFICRLCEIYGIAPGYLFQKRDYDERTEQLSERTKKINTADALLSQMPDHKIDLALKSIRDLCDGEREY